jgi:hypothetical protein
MNAIQANAQRWAQHGAHELRSNAELCIQSELRKAGLIPMDATIAEIDFHGADCVFVETSNGAEFTINVNTGHINQC